MSRPDLILHQYPQSPVSEKVRVALGVLGLDWCAVEIPRLPPKPKLTALTGGYRRTPVLQIGADLYCDSLCILQELARRAGVAVSGPSWALVRWTGAELFQDTLTVVLGHAPEKLPAEFAADRGRLYFGPDFDLQAVSARVPAAAARLRAALAWFEAGLDGDYLTGAQPGIADAALYYLVWFVRGRWADGPALLARFPRLEAWEARVREHGHGRVTTLEADEALAIAKAAEPAPAAQAIEGDAQGLAPGQQVAVRPEGDGGDPWVTGTLTAVTDDRISLALVDTGDLGALVSHYPRFGTVVEPA